MFKATVEITPLELMHIIEDYCEKNGLKGISDQDIVFKIEAVEQGNQRDSWVSHELSKVIIKNVKVGQ